MVSDADPFFQCEIDRGCVGSVGLGVYQRDLHPAVDAVRLVEAETFRSRTF